MILEIQEKTGASLHKICSTLYIPRSTFYEAAQASSMQLFEMKKGEQIETILRHHRGRYGRRRIYRQMAEEGIIA